jgi:trimeric autotransporter adhesin
MKPTLKSFTLLLSSIFFFTVTLLAQPANNLCTTTTVVTPGTACTNLTNQTLFNATDVGSPINAAGTANDVWYSFTTPANIRNIQITVTPTGTRNVNYTNATTYIEAFTSSGTCVANVFTGTSIGTTNINSSVSLTNLAPGTLYYFRVFTTATPTSGAAANWQFSICATYTAVPANDNCGGAIALTIGTTYNTAATATVQNATASAETAGCATGTPDDDVWYRFTTSATQTYASISLTPGTLLKANGAMLQVYSGACGSLTSIACGQEEITITGGLLPSTQYYVRVYSSAAYVTTPAVGAGNNFSILVSSPARANITAGKMNEVYRQTIISAANVLADPWEVTYGADNYLWITEAKGYKVNRMNPVTGAKQVVLDVSQGSTFLPVVDQPFNAQFNIGVNNPQGGFAGLALHPNFTGAAGGENYVYVTYVHTHLGGIAYTNRIVRFLYNTSTNRLESPVSICDTIPGSGDHNSQRMIIAPMTQGGSDYYLFYAAGDMGAGQQFPTNANVIRPQKAQVINAYEGKILRFALSDTCSGTGNQAWIPASNPYNNVAPIVGKSAVWCIGIRNNQGFAYNPQLNILYGSSHGPFSDDEINIIEGFKNYGHPRVIGYAADGNYNGTTTPGLSTSISAGVAYGYTTAPYTVAGQAATVGTCLPIGNETTNMNAINATAALYGAYKDPLFSAYPGPASGAGSVSTIWSAASTPGNAGWHSEGWSGLGLYTNTYIPGWKNALLAAGLKWGRTIRLKLNAAGTAVIPTAGFDTATYFQSTNRYRDMAFSPNGRDIYLSMDRSPAGSAATVGNPPPTVGACLGCVVRYEFLGYNADATSLAGSTISKSIDVTTGPVNTCNTGTTVTINAENGNTNLWVPITGPDGNIMAEINAMGQSLGVVTSSFYKNPAGSLRFKNGIPYLDRNITITPTITGPYGTNVKVRLYISKTEFDDLVNDPISTITNINQLKVYKNTDGCSAAISTNPSTLLTPVNTLAPDLAHGTNGYVLQVAVSDFSSFYFTETNTLLPLELLTFTGSLQNNTTTLLKWKTDNEVNTSHFVVERSIDGTNFNGIGSVAASGNSSTILNYSFNDADAANQGVLTLYYRLKVADANGSFKYSNTISVTLPATKEIITISPNPAFNELKAAIISTVAGRAAWQVIDNTGRTVLYGNTVLRKGSNNLSLNINQLAAGSYYLHVSGLGIDGKNKFQKL